MITQEYLKSLFEYDGKNLLWRITRGMARKGSIAGTINSRGYRHVRIDNKFYQAHRLIWIYINEELPSELQIDHINRDRSDNRIENLRLATGSQNNMNSCVSDRSLTGVKGLYFSTYHDSWCSEVKVNGKAFKKYSKDVEVAKQNLVKLKGKHHGIFAEIA